MKSPFPKIIQLPKISDPRGNLTFIEGMNHIPFEIKRVYWIYDVPGGETRGGHAFKEQDEFIVAISGSFDVIIHNGVNQQVYHLNRSYTGLYIPLGTWRSMENFSTNSIAMVLASTFFDKKDYIIHFKKYLATDFSNFVNENDLKEKQHIHLPNNFSTSTVYDCKVMELDKNHREKGNITVIENGKQIPFDTKRVYYLYDVPGGEERGGHAHKELYQLIVAAGGCFDVVLNDGKNTRTITLNRPYQGLYIVPGIWREIKNFSSGSTCLVLASDIFDEQDYLREYNQFNLYKSV